MDVSVPEVPGVPHEDGFAAVIESEHGFCKVAESTCVADRRAGYGQKAAAAEISFIPLHVLFCILRQLLI